MNRVLEHLPKELLKMSVNQFLEEFHGDLDLAADKLVEFELPCEERMYQSPPKPKPKKRNIKKAKPQQQ